MFEVWQYGGRLVAVLFSRRVALRYAMSIHRANKAMGDGRLAVCVISRRTGRIL